MKKNCRPLLSFEARTHSRLHSCLKEPLSWLHTAFRKLYVQVFYFIFLIAAYVILPIQYSSFIQQHSQILHEPPLAILSPNSCQLLSTINNFYRIPKDSHRTTRNFLQMTGFRNNTTFLRKRSDIISKSCATCDNRRH